MAFLAVDSDNHEYIHTNRPIKRKFFDGTYGLDSVGYMAVRLPKGTIKKLIGRDLTWDDDPVELKVETN